MKTIFYDDCGSFLNIWTYARDYYIDSNETSFENEKNIQLLLDYINKVKTTVVVFYYCNFRDLLSSQLAEKGIDCCDITDHLEKSVSCSKKVFTYNVLDHKTAIKLPGNTKNVIVGYMPTNKLQLFSFSQIDARFRPQNCWLYKTCASNYIAKEKNVTTEVCRNELFAKFAAEHPQFFKYPYF